MPGYRLDRSPAYLLHQVALPHDAIFERWAVRGLTMRQFAVLTTLGERDGVNQMTITQRTGIDRSTMTEIVGRLARRGLLHKRRNRSDMRSFVLRITDEGRRALSLAEPKANAVGALLLFAIPRTQQAAFVACLESLVSALEAPTGKRALGPTRRPAINAREDGSGAQHMSGYENFLDYGGPEALVARGGH